MSQTSFLPINNEHKKLTIKQQVQALEYDICSWLRDNHNLPYEEKHKEILQTLESLKLSNSFILELAIHMLIRMGEAKFVNQQLREFEPLIDRGYKHLRSNRRKARKKRTKGRLEIILTIKKIMAVFKKEGHTFKQFLNAAENKSFEELDIKYDTHIHKYQVIHDDFDKPLIVEKRSIEGWYTYCEKSKTLTKKK